MSPRRQCRTDANHAVLLQAHRDEGWQMISTHWAGQHVAGFPDAIGVHPISRQIVFFEFKDGDGKLDADQIDFHTAFTGPIEIERTADDVRANTDKYMGRL